MKKILLTVVTSLVVTSAAFAQGTLTWSGFVASTTYQTNSTQYSPFFGGQATGSGSVGATAGGATLTYYYELLYNTSFTGSQASSPNLATLLGGTWLDAGLTATNGANANGRINATVPNTAAVVPWSQGTTNNIILVGWSANLGTTWLSASNYLANWATLGSTVIGNSFFGESATGYLSPNAANPGATVFASAATANGLPINTINGQLYLLPVPEPGTIALATLGGLSMLALRRRKA